MSNFLSLIDDYITTGYKSEYSSVPVSSAQTESLEDIENDIKACTNCPLHAGRKNAVPGEGCTSPLVMVIGEGPGHDEDETGRPFVGKAGQLLDKMLSSIGLSRNENAYIANVVKCRPPGNRNPLPEETQACACFLKRQILFLKPQFILLAGKVASSSLLKTQESIEKLRSKFFNLKIEGESIPLMVTYHPAFLLRNESYKRPAWEDLKLLRTKLDGILGEK